MEIYRLPPGAESKKYAPAGRGGWWRLNSLPTSIHQHPAAPPAGGCFATKSPKGTVHSMLPCGLSERSRGIPSELSQRGHMEGSMEGRALVYKHGTTRRRFFFSKLFSNNLIPKEYLTGGVFFSFFFPNNYRTQGENPKFWGWGPKILGFRHKNGPRRGPQ